MCWYVLYRQVFCTIPDLPHITRALVVALALSENTRSAPGIQEICDFMSTVAPSIRTSGAPVLGVYQPAYSESRYATRIPRAHDGFARACWCMYLLLGTLAFSLRTVQLKR